MNFSPESSLSQMMRLPSTSSPTTLSSRIATSSGLSGADTPYPIRRSPYCVIGCYPADTRPTAEPSTTQSTHSSAR